MIEHFLLHFLVRSEQHVEREIAVRGGRCSACGKNATLRTDCVRTRTRLLYFIVLPFAARVRVDHCSECRRAAFVVDTQRWERLRAAAYDAAGAEVERGGEDPRHWLDEHRTRVVFGDEAGAADLAFQLATHPRSDAHVHAELALTQHWQGHAQSSGESERRARELDRAGSALWELELERALDRGDLDAALQRLPRGHSGRGVEQLRQGTLRRLLLALAARGSWRELHGLLAPLLARFPHVAYDAHVRSIVRQLNRRLDGARPITLPRLPGEFRKRNRIVALAGLLVACFLAAELYARTHRPVWLISTAPLAYHLSVDGGPKLHYQGNRPLRVHLSYGHHTLAITGPRTTQFELSLSPPRSWLALLDDSATVVDLGGDALLRVEPGERGTGAPSAVLYGRDDYRFERLESVFGAELGDDYVDRIRGERAGRLVLVQSSPTLIAMQEISAGHAPAALALLEDRVSRAPCDPNLIVPYAWTAMHCGASEPALERLAPCLAREPLLEAAHDAARFLVRDPDSAGALRARYEQLLAREGACALAGVLRAHLCTQRAEALEWVERGQHADPNDLRSVRYAADLQAGVDWNAALRSAQTGLALSPHDPFLLDIRSGARLALGQADELERELRSELESHPRHQERQGRLAELLVATGRSTELDLFIGDQEREHHSGQNGAQRLRVLALEAGGRLEELAASALDLRDDARSRWQMLALCELGRGSEFDRRLIREGRLVDRWFDALVVSLCFDLAGDEPRARRWHELTLKRLAPHSAQAEVARLLRGEEAVRSAEITALALDVHDTSVVLLAMARRARGELRAELLAAAERFHPWPGHVQRLIRRLRTAS